MNARNPETMTWHDFETREPDAASAIDACFVLDLSEDEVRCAEFIEGLEKLESGPDGVMVLKGELTAHRRAALRAWIERQKN